MLTAIIRSSSLNWRPAATSLRRLAKNSVYHFSSSSFKPNHAKYSKLFQYSYHQEYPTILTTTYMQTQKQNTQKIESVIPQKSPNDSRNYQAIILSNGAKVLFIHDQTLEKSACSISVGVGSLQDPQSSLGLAHFLEHMLFMGSTKYPSHNQYSSFINLNSGMDNAYTSDQETNYYFEIANKAFPQAMERLCDFFTGALLTETCVTKQRQAVHQQYILWTNDDNCRKWQILHKLGNPPFKFFSIGNNETLGHENVRKQLVDFYNTKYSANIINAVLCSSMPINEMKKQVLKHIEAIPNKNIPKYECTQPYSKQQLGKLVRMQSIKDETVMEFFFVLSHLRYTYKKHIGDYITHVLGHEGRHSLLSILKSKQYAANISSYQHDLVNQTVIGLDIKLTEQGAQNYEEVYNIVIDYMASLKAEKAIFQEIKEKYKIQFQFKEKTETYQYVCGLSSKMHYIPMNEILNNKSLFDEYNGEEINKYLSQLNPFNAIIVLSNSSQLQSPITQKYLGAKYTINELPQRKSCKVQFNSLEKNPFLPLLTTVLPKNESNVPIKIKPNAYFLKDNQFNVCKGGIRLVVNGTQKNTVLQLYSAYLQHIWKNTTYNAETLSTQIEIDENQKLVLQFFGFNDTVKKLVEKLGNQLESSHYDGQNEKLFEITKQRFLQDLNNFYCQEVNEIAQHMRKIITKQGKISVQQTIKEAQSITYKDFTEKVLNYWRNSTLQWVIVGNFSEENAIQVIQSFETSVNKLSKQQKKSQLNKVGCLKYKEPQIKHQVLLDEEEIKTSCCIVSHQAGEYNHKLYYILQLLKNHINQPFFNYLRTQKQLAYYLAARNSNTRGVLGLYFILVSSSIDAQTISTEIQAFNKDFFSPERLKKDLTAEKFEQIKDSVRVKEVTPHNNLKKLFNFVSTEVNNRTFYFNRKEKQEVNKHLDSITVDDLIKVADQLLQSSVQFLVTCKGHQEEYQKHRPKCLSFQEIQKNGEYFEDHIADINFKFN